MGVYEFHVDFDVNARLKLWMSMICVYDLRVDAIQLRYSLGHHSRN
mgnify:CR=1 FL=1